MDRKVWAFALVGVAAVVQTDGGVAAARIVLSGVAPIPWRAADAEAALIGRPASPETFAQAAEVAVSKAHPLELNGYKVSLARSLVEPGTRGRHVRPLMQSVFRTHGLTIVLAGLFPVLARGAERGKVSWPTTRSSASHGQQSVTYLEYLLTGHFVEAVFENWESEFFADGPLRPADSRAAPEGLG